jgi:hypothetical protein
MGTKSFKRLGTKITKIREQKLQKIGKRNYKNLGTKVTKMSSVKQITATQCSKKISVRGMTTEGTKI